MTAFVYQSLFVLASYVTINILVRAKSNMKSFHSFFILLTIILVLSFFGSANAQSRKAQAADDDFENLRYSLAIPKYKKAYARSKRNKVERNRISYQMAECYRLTNQTKRAEAFYKRLTRVNYDRIEPLVLLRLADMQRANGDYEDALTNYETFLERVPDDELGLTGLESCKLAIEWEKNPANFTIESVKKINSRENDFSPAYSDPTGRVIIFTTSRDGVVGKDTDEWTGLNFTDLFTTRQDTKDNWSQPVSIDQTEAINTPFNEGQPSFNANFGKMYFTRCGQENLTVNGCQIYVTSKQGRGWSEPEQIDLGGDSTSVFGHPAINPSETMMIFASTKKGGAGGRDLWVVTRENERDQFTAPRNLGEVINTRGDELFPFLRGDSVLYFASDGHPGMGGLDIFKSVKQEDGSWAPPVNMKPPVNSHYDDFGICFHPDGLNEGFFSSGRRGGRGGDDIYYFINPPVIFTVKGKILDNNTYQPVENALVSLVSSDGTTVSVKSNAVGYYEFVDEQVKPNVTFEVIVEKEKYFTDKAMETTLGIEASKDFEMNFQLELIPAEPILLPEILYDLAKWDLKPQFQDSLQGLIKTLDANETLVIELAAHTDSRGTVESNDILSQRRAESVVNYLIQRGIDPDRLIAKGYGERVPRKLSNTITRDGLTFEGGTILTETYIDSLPDVKMKEAAHQLNRRTEFSILSNDFVPKPRIRTEEAVVEIVTDPTEHTVKFRKTTTGAVEADCILNGITFSFVYNEMIIRPAISLGSALRLLKDGAITRTDFQGDPERIFFEGSIANRSVFTAKTLRIGGLTLNDVEFQVDHQLKGQVLLGEITLMQFGNFTIDEEKQEIVFE
ncbi:MAG: tetratricopeptide repeat protein [Sphingobacteriia bacterium]|nr:tetratricopeptide repeat protein [Sphingobacteriia bacterium]